MSHTHAPGETHSHSHGPPQQQQQQQIVVNTDPALQALIDQDFTEVPIVFGEETYIALCGPHSLEKCTSCNVDFINMNRLSKLLATNPNLLCPPPPQMVSKSLSVAVTNTKDEGNKFYKMGIHKEAVARYNMAAAIAIQRPPWEANGLMREELSIVLSNRSASYLETRDFISALADAETVIQLRRNWNKGHLRKAKALVGLGQFEEAADAVELGLSFEVGNEELTKYQAEIEKLAKASLDAKASRGSVKKEEAGDGDAIPPPP